MHPIEMGTLKKKKKKKMMMMMMRMRMRMMRMQMTTKCIITFVMATSVHACDLYSNCIWQCGDHVCLLLDTITRSHV